jgi:hypothetical protein
MTALESLVLKFMNFFLKDDLKPMLDENKTTIERVKNEIEASFQNFVQEINKQKMAIFKRLDDVEDEK